MKRETNTCVECESEYYTDTSKMAALCPDCSHYLYGYENCLHVIENNRCKKCYWNGQSSEYVNKLKNETTN